MEERIRDGAFDSQPPTALDRPHYELHPPRGLAMSTFNLTLEEYLYEVRGPKHLPLVLVLSITVVYAIIFVAGIIGNSCVCVVIVKNQYMHTATNYYLFSLAVSDITILLFGLPNDLSVYWQQYPWTMGETFCKIRALVSEMTSYSSVLTVVAFSMERYLAICHPLHCYAMSGRALRVIILLWALSFLAALPVAFFTKINYVDYPPGSGNVTFESAFCALLDENIPPYWPLYEISSIVFFLLPMVVIAVLYTRMGRKIRSSRCIMGEKQKSSGSAVHCEGRMGHSRRTVVRMLAAVVIAFFVCWAPFHAQRLLYVYAKESPNYPQINEWMYYITGFFYYFSSTVNPILYNVMSARYRRAFRNTLCCPPRAVPANILSSSGPTTKWINGNPVRKTLLLLSEASVDVTEKGDVPEDQSVLPVSSETCV